MQLSLYRRSHKANPEKCSPNCRGWICWLDTSPVEPGQSAQARPCGTCWRYYPRLSWPTVADATAAYLDDLRRERYARAAFALVAPALIAARGNPARAARALGIRPTQLERIVRSHPRLSRAMLELQIDREDLLQDASHDTRVSQAYAAESARVSGAHGPKSHNGP